MRQQAVREQENIPRKQKWTNIFWSIGIMQVELDVGVKNYRVLLTYVHWKDKKKLTHCHNIGGIGWCSVIIFLEFLDPFFDDVMRLGVLNLVFLPDLNYSMEMADGVAKSRCLLWWQCLLEFVGNLKLIVTMAWETAKIWQTDKISKNASSASQSSSLSSYLWSSWKLGCSRNLKMT